MDELPINILYKNKSDRCPIESVLVALYNIPDIMNLLDFENPYTLDQFERLKLEIITEFKSTRSKGDQFHNHQVPEHLVELWDNMVGGLEAITYGYENTEKQKAMKTALYYLIALFNRSDLFTYAIEKTTNTYTNIKYSQEQKTNNKYFIQEFNPTITYGDLYNSTELKDTIIRSDSGYEDKTNFYSAIKKWHETYNEKITPPFGDIYLKLYVMKTCPRSLSLRDCFEINDKDEITYKYNDNQYQNPTTSYNVLFYKTQQKEPLHKDHIYKEIKTYVKDTGDFFYYSTNIMDDKFSQRFIKDLQKFQQTFKSPGEMFTDKIKLVDEDQNTTTYYLKSLVCFTPGHYVSFLRKDQKSNWYLYDSLEKDVENQRFGLSNVYGFTDMKGKYYPCIFFFIKYNPDE